MVVRLSVIARDTNTVTATVNTHTQPQMVAVNPVTNKIYVPKFSSSTISVMDGVQYERLHRVE